VEDGEDPKTDLFRCNGLDRGQAAEGSGQWQALVNTKTTA
jgi:hypothetical protein